ncbi:tripartite tricarboxylate transporter permease [Halanaerobium sp. MA284_MarDTE_T2]|uniref:tripartite tricarboxylate transporter permease n=1 Tax=Halanaerobium sp. MA284_MarDTE_T2 TaxID=2183913 RepID=UPI000DF3E0C1|nr:tripartite tricarboxylate transporter permease [Halanaerobium sp. MA284_MarDTE_T2]RCW44394.1 putative tricarboxylic transport membrane protein [Halanaerobium sp. MA284_MarDTE_T2]
MDYISGVIQGFFVLLNPVIFIHLVLGFLIGTFFGAVPGLTSCLAIALLLPITYSMDTTAALVMCMSIFMSGIYSGSITATTINIPGAPSGMMTAIEGYPLMKKGEGAKALGHAAFASMVGGAIGSILLIIFVPVAAQVSLLIKTPGKFSLIFFALVVIILAQRGKSFSKGALATLFGILIGTIGIDLMEPVARLTFGVTKLTGGVQLMPVIIGTFAISELLLQSETGDKKIAEIEDESIKIYRKDFIPTFKEIREIGVWKYLKSSLIGFFTGVLPGAGGSMAAFVSYAEAIRSSKHPEKFGGESIEGIACAEAANNGMCGGALVPMLTFGIPGDATSAIVLGVLIINGLNPGPQLLENQFHLIAPMFAALFISAIVLLPLTLYIFGPYYMKIVSINKGVLYSSIAAISMVGGYVSTYSVFQMGLTLLFGVFAYFLRKNNYPTVSFLLGYILGGMMEEFFRRALNLSHGNIMIFFTEWDSIIFLVLTVIFMYFLLFKKTPLASEEVSVSSD